LTSTKIHRRSIDSQGFVGELRRVIASAIQVGFRVPAGQHGIQIPQSSSRVAPSAPESYPQNLENFRRRATVIATPPYGRCFCFSFDWSPREPRADIGRTTWILFFSRQI
jgi:hypothetical protein